jgi:beta-phosphoglucomutase-like phosphatase (HAD superfamily)
MIRHFLPRAWGEAESRSLILRSSMSGVDLRFAFRVEFTANQELRDKLIDQVKKERFGVGRRPRQPSAVAVQEEASSRHIPDAIKRKVYQRDAGRCTFLDERGRIGCAVAVQGRRAVAWARHRTGGQGAFAVCVIAGTVSAICWPNRTSVLCMAATSAS